MSSEQPTPKPEMKQINFQLPNPVFIAVEQLAEIEGFPSKPQLIAHIVLQHVLKRQDEIVARYQEQAASIMQIAGALAHDLAALDVPQES